MRKIGLFCLVLPAVLGLVFANSTAAEEPGDQLLEVFKKDIPPRESLIPAGVNIAADFKPGEGDPIGKVEALEKRVLVIHGGENTAYTLKKDHPLFAEDTLVTEEKSKAQIEFNDGSFITLGAYTKLVLDRSIYDPSKQTRNSFIRLLFGKARFIVKKLVDFRSAKYEVKTPTAVVGVRGSDFAVGVSYVNPLNTTLVTGPDTTVLFAGDVGPAQIIGPMQASNALAGGAAAPGVGVSVYSLPGLTFGGLSQGAMWAIGGGLVLGVGGGALILNDDDSGSGSAALEVIRVTPPELATLSGLDVVNNIIFGFNKAINPLTAANFVINSIDVNWNIVAVNNQDPLTVIVQLSNPNSIPGAITLELVNVSATDGTPLTGQTSFQYSGG